MKIIMKPYVAIASFLMLGGLAVAQPAPPAAPGAPAAAPAATFREPPSNDQVGLDINHFVGDPHIAMTYLSHDVILTQPILTQGDPNAPGKPGATLRYRKQVDLGTLFPGEASPLAQMPEQQVWYIEDGQGRLDDGKNYWDLHPGIALIIPPNQIHRLVATGDKPLKLLMLSYDMDKLRSVKSPSGILVRDTAKVLYTERNVHWSNFAKYLFTDLGERIFIVYMGPTSIAGAHAHGPDDEECWIKITDEPAMMQLGSQIRPWQQNVGLEAPTTGQTVHAAINLSDKVQAWFYFARPFGEGAQRPATAPAQPPNPNRPRLNPAVGESAALSTVAGKPLSSLKDR